MKTTTTTETTTTETTTKTTTTTETHDDDNNNENDDDNGDDDHYDDSENDDDNTADDNTTHKFSTIIRAELNIYTTILSTKSNLFFYGPRFPLTYKLYSVKMKLNVSGEKNRYLGKKIDIMSACPDCAG